jgi:signal peptidase I
MNLKLIKFFKKKNKKPEIKTKQSLAEESWGSFFNTLIVAIVCATIVRSFFYEPFHIPSSSMKSNLLIGDYIFVSKFSYGYSRYSFPFAPNLFSGRVFETKPKRGDVAVFRLPSDPRINYIKRLIGLPGDKIQVTDGQVFINEKPVAKTYIDDFLDEDNNSKIRRFVETLPEGKEITILDQLDTPQDNTGVYVVPEGHYFMMGDNRDNSQDSRFLNAVGYVPKENLVGKASIIFFSNELPFWQFWSWHKTVRWGRIFHSID